MILYHYTDKNNLKEIKPYFFGKNYYTSNDKTISNVKRSFFYDKKNPEYLLSDKKYCYKIKIDKNNIYDLAKDKNKYCQRYNDIDKILRILKKEYQGITYNNGFQCYCIFKIVNCSLIK